MLSDQEQKVWNEFERRYRAEAEDVARRLHLDRHAAGQGRSGRFEDIPVIVVAGAWIAVLLLFVGVLPASVAVGVATALGWLLWSTWPRLRAEATPSDRMGGP